MATHFSWLEKIPGVDHGNIHVATLGMSVGLLLVGSVAGYASLKSQGDDVAPAGKLSLRGIFELLVEFIVSLSDRVLGEHNRKYVPLFGAIFITILFNNLIGMIPGMLPATENFNTTFALGVFSFLTYNYLGLKENGMAYLKHFMGPVWWLAPLMVIIELISHFVRPLSLAMRLRANMMADHTVMGIAVDMAGSFGVPLLAYGLGLFVCFIQAFVFTVLSMAYVSLATAHDH